MNFLNQFIFKQLSEDSDLFLGNKEEWKQTQNILRDSVVSEFGLSFACLWLDFSANGAISGEDIQRAHHIRNQTEIIVKERLEHIPALSPALVNHHSWGTVVPNVVTAAEGWVNLIHIDLGRFNLVDPAQELVVTVGLMLSCREHLLVKTGRLREEGYHLDKKIKLFSKLLSNLILKIDKNIFKKN